jgi:hypothetical protein
MPQQYQVFPPGCYRQGHGTTYLDNEVSYFQEHSGGVGSAAMDRGQGLSNNSISTDNSDSAWSDLSWNTNITAASPMSTWEEVPSFRIKGEDNAYTWDENMDSIEYSPAGSQGFQTPMPQSSSFTETTMEARHTPTSLGWSPHSRLLEMYKFVVGKGGNGPYFQLLDGYAVMEQTPARVFLDLPRYGRPLYFLARLIDVTEAQRKVPMPASIPRAAQASKLFSPDPPISNAITKTCMHLRIRETPSIAITPNAADLVSRSHAKTTIATTFATIIRKI